MTILFGYSTNFSQNRGILITLYASNLSKKEFYAIGFDEQTLEFKQLDQMAYLNNNNDITSIDYFERDNQLFFICGNYQNKAEFLRFDLRVMKFNIDKNDSVFSLNSIAETIKYM